MISIVIPAYNEENSLEWAIRSLQQQDIISPFEIIVIDNNSTDQTSSIAQKFGCRVVHEPRQGITYARKKGLQAARGDIVVQFDADCTAPATWLQDITQPFFEDSQVIFTHGLTQSAPATCKSRLYFTVINLLKHLCQKTTWMSSGYNLAYRKKAVHPLLENEKYLELKYYEDTYLSFEVGKLVGKKVFVPTAVVFTSGRRIENESLLQRVYLWSTTMLYYILYQRFPNWAYLHEYRNYRE